MQAVIYLALMLGSFVLFPERSQAITIASNTNANDLAAALTSGTTGLVVTSATLSGQSQNGAVSTGTFTNASGTYGIGSGIALSTGNVLDYGDGPNTQSGKSTAYGVPATAPQEGLLKPISANPAFNHFDVTQLDITFDMNPGFNQVFFNVVFGTEEFPEFVGSSFIDAFGLFLNGTNIAIAQGQPVNVNHPGLAAIPGTELDGVLALNGNPVLLFSGMVGDGSKNNVLTFIVSDTSDDILDTTVYLSSLGGTPPPIAPGGAPVPVNVIPEPASWLLLGSGLAGLDLLRRGQKRRGGLQ